MDQTKPRKPVISFLLSLIFPGLGQVYNGSPLRGIVFYCGFWALLIGLALGGLIFSLRGMISLAVIAVLAQVLISVDAAVGAARRGVVRMRWYNRWYLYLCVVLVGHLVLTPAIDWVARYQTVGLRTYRMAARSMMPALGKGDCVLVKLRPYARDSPQRGDIIVFPYPGDKSKPYLKRIIGLPGEQLEIKDKAVFINGRGIDDPWGVVDRHMPPQTVPMRDNYGPITIPDGTVFVMGDNRDFSHDSRFWGCVEIKDISGKALFIYWSEDPNRIGKQLD